LLGTLAEGLGFLWGVNLGEAHLELLATADEYSDCVTIRDTDYLALIHRACGYRQGDNEDKE
jgi:hypothetical protein